MSRSAQAIVNIDNIKSNYQLSKVLAPGSRVMAVVKANAYGHGAVAVAQALSEADAFGVAELAEALELREAGITAPIVLLGGVFDAAEWSELGRLELQAVIHTKDQLDSFLAHKPHRPDQPAVLWLKIDTGMHRLGFSPADFVRVRQALMTSGRLKELIVMSHFSSADEIDNPITETQLALFEKSVGGLDHSKSLANSAALIGYPASHYDWVRPGIMLYGVNPLSGQGLGSKSLPSGALSLRPVMSLRSRLVAIRDVAAGDVVGYGGQWQASEVAKIGTVAIGYGDGYPRHAPNGTPVLVGGQRAVLAGCVSMDYITVDLADVPQAQVGDEVELWGEGLAVGEIAALSETIAYELLTGVRSRVNYCYLRG